MGKFEDCRRNWGGTAQLQPTEGDLAQTVSELVARLERDARRSDFDSCTASWTDNECVAVASHFKSAFVPYMIARKCEGIYCLWYPG